MDLGYINTRVRAWKGKLLKDEDYNRLISLESIQSLFDSLKETWYRKDIEVSRSRFGDAEFTELIEYALKENFFSTLRTLWEDAPQEAQRLLCPVISIWEVYNLKTLIRGIDKGFDREKIYKKLLPVGDFDESALRELNQQRDIASVMELLITWGIPYWRPLKSCYPEYEKTHSLFSMEMALDRFLYPFLLKSMKGKRDANIGIVNSFLRDRIDMINILTLLKVARSELPSLPVSRYYIQGGKRLCEKSFTSLFASRDIEKLLRGLEDSILDYRWVAAIKGLTMEEVDLLEEELDGLIAEDIGRKALVQPLSIAVMLHYILMKHKEIKRLRFILMAKDFNIPMVEAKRFLK